MIKKLEEFKVWSINQEQNYISLIISFYKYMSDLQKLKFFQNDDNSFSISNIYENSILLISKYLNK